MIEYTHRLEFDVLSAPLAEIDRRALSQAWYSALHLAAAPAASSGPPAHPGRGPVRSRSGRAFSPSRNPGTTPANARVARATRESAVPAVSSERRSPRSELARRIERVVVRPPAQTGGAFFALRGPYGRVQILLRSRAGRMMLIAVCSPEARADVARALDQARFALARGGVAACAVRVRETTR